MLDPILKFVFSLTFLQNQGIERTKAFAAGTAAAVIPGLGGLAVPLIVAGQSQPTFRPGVSDRGTLAEVPNVIGKEEEEAKGIIRGEKLNPVSESFSIHRGKVEDIGKVVEQVPEQGKLVRVGAPVKLTVSLGAPAATEEESIHQRIEQDVEAAQQQILVAQNQITDAKATIIEARDTILTAIATKGTSAKGTSQSGGPT